MSGVQACNSDARPKGTRLLVMLAPWLTALCLAVAAAVVFHRSPRSASEMEIFPDSVEYAAGGWRLAFDGTCALRVGDRDLPSRYPPWFSLLVAAPAYHVLGPEPGNPIHAVRLLAILGVLCAFLAGRRAGGEWGGLLAGLTVLLLPLYHSYARQILTDVPATALLLAAAAVHVHLAGQPSPRLTGFLAGGFLVACAGSFRSLFLAAILPMLIPAFAGRPGAVARRLAALAVFPALLIAATLLYNHAVFGDVMRNGYRFWCPVPYDYGNLTFAPRYLFRNVAAARDAGVGWALLTTLTAAIAMLIRRRQPAAACGAAMKLIGFALITGAVIGGIHLLYFFSEERFWLPVVCLLGVATAAALGHLLPRRYSVAVWPVATVAAMILIARGSPPDREPMRRPGAESIRQGTAPGAWVITGLDPVYLRLILGSQDQRRIIPISRNVEYASKLIAPQRVPHPEPPPTGSRDHRCEGLRKGGAMEAVDFVASERLDEIVGAVRAGTNVWLDLSFVLQSDTPVWEALQTRFQLEPLGGTLYRLQPRQP